MECILRFSMPVFLANVLQQVYNMADSLIVGRFVGKAAFAGVGSTGSISFLVMGFVLGMCTGVTIHVAQRFGAADLPGTREKIIDAVYVSAISGFILTVLTVLFTRDLLVLMQTPEDIFPHAYTYIFIIFLGIPATILYNLPANIARALGDSRTPLYFLLLSAFLNVLLDLLFVCVFRMGVMGTAIATDISQAVSGIACIVYLFRKYHFLRFTGNELGFRKDGVSLSAKVGLPMGFQFSITAIGTLVIQSAVNTLGSDAVAAVNAANKVGTVIIQPFEALGVTIATFSGQNLGAGRTDRIREGIRKSLLICVFFSVIGLLLNISLCPRIALIFMKKEDITEFIGIAVRQYLLYNGLTYVLLGSLLIFRNALQGMGFSVAAMGAGLFEMIARTVIAFASSWGMGYFAICLANPAAWIMANVILIPLYWYVRRRDFQLKTV